MLTLRYRFLGAQDMWTAHDNVVDAALPVVEARSVRLRADYKVVAADGTVARDETSYDSAAQALRSRGLPRARSRSALMNVGGTPFVATADERHLLLTVELNGSRELVGEIEHRVENGVAAFAHQRERIATKLHESLVDPRPSTSEAGTPTSPEVGWLERTWRDHAALLVITIIGTVAAAAIVAALKIGN